MNMTASFEHFSHYDHLISDTTKYGILSCKCQQRILNTQVSCLFSRPVVWTCSDPFLLKQVFTTLAEKSFSLKKIKLHVEPPIHETGKSDVCYTDKTYFVHSYL